MANAIPHHHLDADLLLDYAAGKTNEATSVLVATHLALCPACRAELRHYESLGGALVEAEAPAEIAEGALAAVLARLDENEPEEPAPAPEVSDPATIQLVPQPLRAYLHAGLNGLNWRTRGIGIKEASLDLGDPTIRASLLRIAPGTAIPSHTHDGIETTMVLQGAFNDTTGRYARGDIAVATDELDHRPIAEADEECICFVMVEGDLKLTGRFTRLLNPFVRL